MAALLGAVAMDVLRLVCIIAAAALLLALAPWPYAYYQLLRVAIFAAGIFGAVTLWHKEQPVAVALLICGLVFNPLIPMHLTREIWSVLNIVAALMFAFAAYRVGRT